MKRALALLAACIMALGLFSACSNGGGKPGPDPSGTEAANTAAPSQFPDSDPNDDELPDPTLGESYTLDLACAKLPACWDPQRADTEAGKLIASLITAPLVKAQPVDTETGEFRWTYELAQSVTDVTEERTAELDRLGVDRTGKTGLAFEIKLSPSARWENGERITADDLVYSMKALLDPAAKLPAGAAFVTGSTALAGGFEYRSRLNAAGFPSVSFERGVGFFKTDESTVVYICEAPAGFDDIMRLLSTPFIVYRPYHEGGDYCTSPENTMGCGAYRLDSVEEGEIVLTRDPRYPGWERAEDGSMTAFTAETVNGEHVLRYQTTRVVLHELSHSAAEQELLAGRLTVWEPEGEEIKAYSATSGYSEYSAPLTSGVFFNTDPEVLRAADKTKGNINSVVLSNLNFRKAISLSIDRAAWCQELGGKPFLGLIGPTALYDPWNDPASYFCETEIYLQALCALYGVGYGEGTEFISSREASASITGFNEAQAAALFRRACEELTAEGLYTAGDTVKIRVACPGRSAANERAMALLSGFVGEAAKESGFGKVIFECIGDIRVESAVAAGDFAMGFAPFEADPLHPFDSLRACCDPVLYPASEAECSGIAEKPLTVSVQGTEITMSFKEWSRSMTGAGRFAEEPIGIRLQILAELETAVIGEYCRIPISQQFRRTAMNRKAQPITQRFSPLYGLGGVEFTVYNFNDTEWESFIASAGGQVYK